MDDEEKMEFPESEGEEDGQELNEIFDDEHADQLRTLGIKVNAEDVTHDQVLYLLDHYPFIQLLNSDPHFENFEGVKVTQASSTGWQIHDLGDALSSSPGEYLYQSGTFFGSPPFEQAEGEEAQIENGSNILRGQGTIYKKSFLTAQELVTMAKDRWEGIYIVAGTPYIKWCVWAEAEIAKVSIYGYEPQKADKDRQVRLARYEAQQSTRQR